MKMMYLLILFCWILKIQKDLGKKSTSLWSKNGNKTTIDDYSSDAPELTTTDQNEANVSSVKNTLKSDHID